ncbi:MAG: magnesium transporter [Bacilli bacterium]|nr:magnesium transporter [Bacilli bacterium]
MSEKDKKDILEEEEEKAKMEIDPEEEEIEEEDPDSPLITTEELSQLINNRDKKGLAEVFETIPDIDIAEAANDLDPKELIYIFRSLRAPVTANFFDELNDDSKELLIKAMTDKELVAIINEQYADDVADVVGDLPANLAQRVLKAADKEMRADINQLLRYKEGTAGSIMTTEYLEMVKSTKVDDAIDIIREKGKDAETIYTIFVRDRTREFVGTVDLDDLIFAKKSQTLEDIMNVDVQSVTASTDKEEVANIFRRYDLTALAVLNDDDRLVGIITVDDAVDVMAEENAEDLAHMTNMAASDQPYMEMSVWDNAKKCFPWIIALLVLGTFVTLVLNRLEGSAIFTAMPILVSFVPALMDTAGNSGGQTTGMMIRGLATQEFGPKQTLKVVWKEFRSALVVAAFVSVFTFIWIMIEQYTGIVVNEKFSHIIIWDGSAFTHADSLNFFFHALAVGGTVAIAMFFAVTVSKCIGTLLCMGAAAIKKDPALLAQPMLTTVMDVSTLLVYWLIATLLIEQVFHLI